MNTDTKQIIILANRQASITVPVRIKFIEPPTEQLTKEINTSHLNFTTNYLTIASQTGAIPITNNSADPNYYQTNESNVIFHIQALEAGHHKLVFGAFYKNAYIRCIINILASAITNNEPTEIITDNLVIEVVGDGNDLPVIPSDTQIWTVVTDQTSGEDFFSCESLLIEDYSVQQFGRYLYENFSDYENKNLLLKYTNTAYSFSLPGTILKDSSSDIGNLNTLTVDFIAPYTKYNNVGANDNTDKHNFTLSAKLVYDPNNNIFTFNTYNIENSQQDVWVLNVNQNTPTDLTTATFDCQNRNLTNLSYTQFIDKLIELSAFYENNHPVLNESNTLMRRKDNKHYDLINMVTTTLDDNSNEDHIMFTAFFSFFISNVAENITVSKEWNLQTSAYDYTILHNEMVLQPHISQQLETTANSVDGAINEIKGLQDKDLKDVILYGKGDFYNVAEVNDLTGFTWKKPDGTTILWSAIPDYIRSEFQKRQYISPTTTIDNGSDVGFQIQKPLYICMTGVASNYTNYINTVFAITDFFFAGSVNNAFVAYAQRENNALNATIQHVITYDPVTNPNGKLKRVIIPQNIPVKQDVWIIDVSDSQHNTLQTAIYSCENKGLQNLTYTQFLDNITQLFTNGEYQDAPPKIVINGISNSKHQLGTNLWQISENAHAENDLTVEFCSIYGDLVSILNNSIYSVLFKKYWDYTNSQYEYVILENTVIPQPTTDNNLTTTSKGIVEAINEVNRNNINLETDVWYFNINDNIFTFSCPKKNLLDFSVNQFGVYIYEHKDEFLNKGNLPILIDGDKYSSMELGGDFYLCTHIDNSQSETYGIYVRFINSCGMATINGFDLKGTYNPSDPLASSFDFGAFAPCSLQPTADIYLHTEAKSIVNAINEVKASTDLKQDATDNSLVTTDKTVPGAIKELKTTIDNKHVQDVWVVHDDFENGTYSCEQKNLTGLTFQQFMDTIANNIEEYQKLPFSMVWLDDGVFEELTTDFQYTASSNTHDLSINVCRLSSNLEKKEYDLTKTYSSTTEQYYYAVVGRTKNIQETSSNALTTTSKSIVDAINEVKGAVYSNGNITFGADLLWDVLTPATVETKTRSAEVTIEGKLVYGFAEIDIRTGGFSSTSKSQVFIDLRICAGAPEFDYPFDLMRVHGELRDIPDEGEPNVGKFKTNFNQIVWSDWDIVEQGQHETINQKDTDKTTADNCVFTLIPNRHNGRHYRDIRRNIISFHDPFDTEHISAMIDCECVTEEYILRKNLTVTQTVTSIGGDKVFKRTGTYQYASAEGDWLVIEQDDPEGTLPHQPTIRWNEWYDPTAVEGIITVGFLPSVNINPDAIYRLYRTDYKKNGVTIANDSTHDITFYHIDNPVIDATHTVTPTGIKEEEEGVIDLWNDTNVSQCIQSGNISESTFDNADFLRTASHGAIEVIYYSAAGVVKEDLNKIYHYIDGTWTLIQPSIDNLLTTTDKTVPGAINELNANKAPYSSLKHVGSTSLSAELLWDISEPASTEMRVKIASDDIEPIGVRGYGTMIIIERRAGVGNESQVFIEFYANRDATNTPLQPPFNKYVKMGILPAEHNGAFSTKFSNITWSKWMRVEQGEHNTLNASTATNVNNCIFQLVGVRGTRYFRDSKLYYASMTDPFSNTTIYGECLTEEMNQSNKLYVTQTFKQYTTNNASQVVFKRQGYYTFSSAEGAWETPTVVWKAWYPVEYPAFLLNLEQGINGEVSCCVNSGMMTINFNQITADSASTIVFLSYLPPIKLPSDSNLDYFKCVLISDDATNTATVFYSIGSAYIQITCKDYNTDYYGQMTLPMGY